MGSSIEIKNLLGFAKKIVKKQTLKRIKRIEDNKEKLDALKYTIKNELEMMHYDLTRRIKKMEKEKKDIFCEEVKTSLLISKIKYFLISFHKNDFKGVISLYKEIEKGLKNV